MNEQIWYVYQNAQQLGPFTAEQIQQMVLNKMITEDAYLFKVGWRDWRPVEETYGELGIQQETASPEQIQQRRVAAPRATIKGRVVVHNNGELTIGSGVNISATGIFVETQDQIFSLGERLKVSVRVEGFSKPFNAVARVVRYNSDAQYPVGYGLCFEGLDEGIANEIQAAVDQQNGGQPGREAVR